jgi:hypothetical protein
MAGAAEAAPERPEVVKSGVVDGMAYTLYADGSIEANLPEGPFQLHCGVARAYREQRLVSLRLPFAA